MAVDVELKDQLTETWLINQRVNIKLMDALTEEALKLKISKQLDKLTTYLYIHIMISMSVGEFKKKFSQVIEDIKAGEKVAVTFGRDKRIVGYFTGTASKVRKRNLGLLEGKAVITFSADFKMTDEELFNS